MNTSPHRTGRTALIVMKNVIVAADVSETLNAVAGEDWHVVEARSLQDAIRASETAAPVSLAILDADPDDLVASPLGEALRASDARIVLVGEAAEQRGRDHGFHVLERPFTAQDLEKTLHSVLSGH